MRKKILITGASGFIGRNLIRSLEDSDCEIMSMVRRSSGLKGEIITDFCDSGFRSMLEKIPAYNVIVHLAAHVGWDGSKKVDLFQPNVLATALLADLTYRRKAHFIFASAAIVCGVSNEHICFNSKPSPDTDYGYSKWLAEEIIKFSGVRHTILRIGGVFGPAGPSHLGINRAINGALSGTIPVQNGAGKEKRNYIYVNDLCEVIKYSIKESIEGTHLVAGSYVNTIDEMLTNISGILMNGKSPVRHLKARGTDQLIENSCVFPKGRSFRKALEDIKNDYMRK